MRLTKSQFVTGMKCPSLLWHQVHDPDALPTRTVMDEMVMRQGVRIGRLAQGLFPRGVVLYGEPEVAAERTQKLLSVGIPLFEPAFMTDDLLCRVDALIPEDDGVRVVEVKSSGSVKDDHVLDVAFQVHVLRTLGLTVARASVMHVNTKYTQEGALDLSAFLAEEEVTEQLTEPLGTIQQHIERLLAVIGGERPTEHCGERRCPLTTASAKDLPAGSVRELYCSDGSEWIERGVTLIADIPDDAQLKPAHAVQREALRTGEPQVKPLRLRAWLDKLEGPIIYLDFETVNPAIPPFDGMHPYQQLPFQFSAHIEAAQGIAHVGFLGDGVTDPRRELAERLASLPAEGTVLAHNATFEKGVLLALAQQFPDLAAPLTSLRQRTEDLIVPFRNFWYYHPDQGGSCSLKDVYAALCEGSHASLAVPDGAAAQATYLKLCECNIEERERLCADLSEYCSLDTSSMADILRVLRDSC